MPVIAKYGPEAVSALPLLEDYLARINGKPQVRLPSDAAILLQDAIKKIKGEKATEPKTEEKK